VARVLLVVPTGSYRVGDFLDAAAALGVEVTVAAGEELPLSTTEVIRVDLTSPRRAAEVLADAAAISPIDAIVAVDDAGVIPAALAAEALGLPHNPPWAAAATRNKSVMRRALQAAEIPQPAFSLLESDADPSPAAAEVGYPLVVKPLSLSGSRGVIKVEGPRDLEAVVERVRRIVAEACSSPSEPLLMEEFVPGPEVAVEAILRGGELEILAVFDKPDPLDGPYFEETIYVTPSRLHPEVIEELERVTAAACRALGLVEGPIHAELRVGDGKVTLLETAARSIGGLCSRALKFGLMGVSLETLILRHAAGLPPVQAAMGRASGVMMLPIPAAGTIGRVEGVELARAVPGITSVEITAPPGTYLRPVPESDRYLGFLFAAGPTPEQVVEVLREAHARLEITLS
jgi:biotin carboxylase